MVSELWSQQKFDIERLKSHFREFVLPLEPVYQSPAFGGWSVLSSNGSYKDGWHRGHRLFNEDEKKTEQVKDAFIKAGIKRSQEYVVPTEICHGYLQEVMSQLSSHGLNPCRVRIIQLAAGMSSIWHRDYADHEYGVRLHIPIITNSGCFFETETEREHLVADGSAYFIAVNRVHRVINEGSTHRYHIVGDVKDTQGITKYHRYA